MLDCRGPSPYCRVVTIEGIHADTLSVRRVISRHLIGRGIELGPGAQPFPLDLPGVSVRYLDRWRPQENQALFAEVDEDPFVPPDVVCDLNTEKLRMIRGSSQDFVIASHVLEHVADPIGLLDEIHRVLRPGGLTVILLPDMRRTFDRERTPARLDHLVAEYEAGVTQVDDDHLHEFLQHTDPGYQTVSQGNPDERQRLFELHRKGSIHVHCWSEGDFLAVIDFALRTLGHRWEFVDGILTDDEAPEGFEFGYVLRRSTVEDMPTCTLIDHFHAAYDTWTVYRRDVQRVQRWAVEAPRPRPAPVVQRAAGRAKRVLTGLVAQRS